jgi:hypothetical protein
MLSDRAASEVFPLIFDFEFKFDDKDANISKIKKEIKEAIYGD